MKNVKSIADITLPVIRAEFLELLQHCGGHIVGDYAIDEYYEWLELYDSAVEQLAEFTSTEKEVAMNQASPLEEIGELQEWQDWATGEMECQQRRILELEGQPAYLESLLVSASRKIRQQRRRICQLEDRLVDADIIADQSHSWAVKQVLEVHKLLTTFGVGKRAWPLPVRVRFFLEEVRKYIMDDDEIHAYERTDVGCIHRELVDLVGEVALLMEEMGDRAGVPEE